VRNDDWCSDVSFNVACRWCVGGVLVLWCTGWNIVDKMHRKYWSELFGYFSILDLINVRKMEHIKISENHLTSKNRVYDKLKSKSKSTIYWYQQFLDQNVYTTLSSSLFYMAVKISYQQRGTWIVVKKVYVFTVAKWWDTDCTVSYCRPRACENVAMENRLRLPFFWGMTSSPTWKERKLQPHSCGSLKAPEKSI
jgi:hypothetical protein